MAITTKPKPTGTSIMPFPSMAGSANPAAAPKPKSGNLMLDMPSLTETVFTDQYAKTEARQAAEMKKALRDEALTQQGNREISVVNDQSRAAADVIRQRQLDLLQNIDQNVGKANKAMELTDSTNPMDRMTLWYLQQSDPAYTRDGNMRRIEYLTSTAAAIGAVGSIQQQGYVDQTEAVMARTELAKMEGNEELTMLTLLEKQGGERIAAIESMVATQAGMLQNTNLMRQSALAAAPDEAVAAALDKANAEGLDSVSIQGVEVPKSFLQERAAQIADRKYQLDARSMQLTEIALSNMDGEQVEEALNQASMDETGIFVTDDGVSISRARLQERQAALTNVAYSNITMAEGIRQIDLAKQAETDKRILGNMNTVELNTILQAGGKWAEKGIQFDPAQVKTMYDQKKAADTEADSAKLLAMYGAFSAEKPKQHMDYLDSIHVPAGNVPLQQMIDEQRSRTKVAAALLDDPTMSGESKLNIHAGLDAERKNLDEAITATALKQAGNDKNLATIFEAHIRGQALPPAVMEGIIVDESDKGNSLAPYLGSENNGIFLEAKSALKASLMQEEFFQIMSREEQDDYVVQQALSQVKSQASGMLTTKVMAGQVGIEGNPINKVMTAPQFLMLVKTAEDEADAAYAQQQGWNQEQLATARVQGTDTGLAYAQMARTIMAMDEKKSGLGKAYVDWWNSEKATSYVGDFVAREAQLQSTPQDLALWSLTAPGVAGDMQAYGLGLVEAHQFTYAQQLATEHAKFANFGGDPVTKQVFLLQQTEGLSDSDKQIAISIIQPLIDEAKSMTDMSPVQQSQYVEGKLRQIVPPSGDATRVWKKVLEGRGKALQVVDDFIGAQQLAMYSPGIGPGFGREASPNIKSMGSEVGRLTWYTDLTKAK